VARAIPVVRPSDYPPPFSNAEVIAEPTDAEPIEVGACIVGAGPAGLACAIRLGQLLEEDPATAERLGDVPVVVVDKGKQPGSHLLSGAVVNPGALQRLFGGRKTLEELPLLGPVPGERVYVLTSKLAFPIPPPPTMRNHGNYLVSLSKLGRWLAAEAETAGAMMLSETAATQLLVAGGQVRGIRTGDKGRGREGQVLGNFEPGSDLRAGVTVLCEGTQGYLTGAALDHFGFESEFPQTWELGVKEVWRVPRKLDRIVHTMGWPLRPGARFREFGGTFIYPMGDDLLTIGIVVGLDHRDSALSVHDLLQEVKTHPTIRKLLEGGERLEWGAKTITSGGFLALPRQLHAPGLLLAGEGAGFVNVPTLKGIHYAIETGIEAAEATFKALQQEEGPARVEALASYDEAVRASSAWRELRQVRNMRQVFGRGFFVGGALASLMTVSKGRFPGGSMPTERDAGHSLITTDRAARYPAPDGKLTFDKLSSVFASGNKTRDDQPSHIRVQRKVPQVLGELWEHMCPAQVYEVTGADGEGTVSVQVTPSNCVQCGAITAKGGRLTPPEGGSGPEYEGV
jgi:electron-transferring-flavoprotein dehydrogenase